MSMQIEFTATVTGSVPQLVRCAHCAEPYVYEMQRSATGTVSGRADPREREDNRARAEERAREKLEDEFRDLDQCDPVPCRHCHRYQRYMFRAAADRKYLDHTRSSGCLVLLGLVAAVVGGFVAADKPHYRLIALLAAVAGVAVLILGGLYALQVRRLKAVYDPNAERPEVREKDAAAHANTLAEYEQRQAVRVRRAYYEHLDAKNPKPLVVTLWVEPTVLINGGTLSLDLSDRDRVTVTVPEDTRPGKVLRVTVASGTPAPFKVRVVPFGVHPGEVRLD
jgi:hypothetical protein